MEQNSAELEKAFLGWINNLGDTKEKLTSLKQLKDGIFLIKLLHGIDKAEFPIEGFDLKASEHWAACAKNLERLTSYMEKYILSKLKPNFEKNYVNIQAVAQNEDLTHILRMLEMALGIVGNCPDKEKYIDPILKLDSGSQTILMDIMIKYIKVEDRRKSIIAMEADILDSLKIQLKEKEIDRHTILEHVSQQEKENIELALKNEELEKALQSKEVTVVQLHKELAEAIKKADAIIPPPAVDDPRVPELESKVRALTLEHAEFAKAAESALKKKEEEKNQIQDELYALKQKQSHVEKLVETQKNTIEKLTLKVEQQKDGTPNIEEFDKRIIELEKANKELMEKYKTATTSLRNAKQDVIIVEEKLKRAEAKVSEKTEACNSLEEKKKHWEQRAKQVETQVAALTEQCESLKFSTGAGNLMTQQEELKTMEKIRKLEEQNEILAANSSVVLITKNKDLEANLEVVSATKDKVEQELAQVKTKNDEMKKENTQLKEELEIIKLNKSSNVDLAKEIQRIKKDRDMLLDAVSGANATAKQFDICRKELETLKTECQFLNEKKEASEKEKVEADKMIHQLKTTNLEYEKQLARQEEKISLLQDERAKTEGLIKDVMKQSDIDKEKRIAEEVKKEKEKLQKSFAEQISKMEEALITAQKELKKKSDELASYRKKSEDKEKKLISDYDKLIETLKRKLEVEKVISKKGLKELDELSKRQEKMFSSQIYEIGGVMNQIITEKKIAKPALDSSQLTLSKLSEERTLSPQRIVEAEVEKEAEPSPTKKPPVGAPPKLKAGLPAAKKQPAKKKEMKK